MEVLRQSSCCDSQPEANLSPRATSLGNYSDTLVWSRPKDPDAEQMPPVDASAQLIILHGPYVCLVDFRYSISKRWESRYIHKTKRKPRFLIQDDSGWRHVWPHVWPQIPPPSHGLLVLFTRLQVRGLRASLAITEGRSYLWSVCWVQDMIFGEVPWQYDRMWTR